MRQLLAQPLARRILAVTAIGSLADWTIFAALVVVVGTLTEGSVFAVALVACARVAPACLVGPLLAPYAGVFGTRRTLVITEVARAAAIAAVAVSPSLGTLVAGLVVLEVAAALGTATREAAISAGVDPATFRQLNASTGGLSYGMVPLGGLVAALLLRVGPLAPFALAVLCAAVNAVLYARAPGLGHLRRRERTEVSVLDGLRAIRATGPLRDVVAVAAAGAFAIAMLFSVAPAVAADLFGRPEDHGLLLATLGVGALAGGLAAQRGLVASTGMVVAALGSVAVLAGGMIGTAGVAAIGAGAAVVYVITQERLQTVGRAPEDFAAGFAVMKVSLVVALLGAPLLHRLGGQQAVVIGMVAASGVGWSILVGRIEAPAGLPLALPARAFTAVGRLVLPHLCHVRVSGRLPDGAAVIVANHPNGLDGPAAMLLDRRIRPVARPQRNVLARVGFALSGTLLTGRATTASAVEHLRRGGMVWLAPEGGITRGPLRRPRTGAARMAGQAGVPIVPMAIRYADPYGPRLWAWRPWRRPTVEIRLGAALPVTAAAHPVAVGDVYMAELAKMLDTTYEPSVRRSSAGPATGWPSMPRMVGADSVST